MRIAALILGLLLMPGFASAQTLFDQLRGQYGSLHDPAASCDVNPHQLDFMANPPHLLILWPGPWIDANGETQDSRRYDLLDADDKTLTLRREDDMTQTDTGARPIWILRHTTQPEGYCWGRTDWPAMRCEDQQVRCTAPVS